ncbi:MAG: hypothetical protein LKE40_11440 [Spirochaetia bacterium]|nr:hypothetical protein [Spirochaetia bacterium]
MEDGFEFSFSETRSIVLTTKVRCNRTELACHRTEQRDGIFRYDFNKLSIDDEIQTGGPFMKITRHVQVRQAGNYELKLSIAHQGLDDDAEIFIPCVLYRKNLKGKGIFPNLDIARQWSFIETRMSIPGCIQKTDRNNVFIAGHRANTIKTSVSWDTGSVTYRLPAEEWPYCYGGKQTLEDTSASEDSSSIALEAGQEISQEYYIGFAEQTRQFAFYNRFVTAFFSSEKDLQKPALNLADFRGLLLRHLLFLTRKEGKLAYVKMGEGNGDYQPIYEFTSASFLVKSLEAACIFLETDIGDLKAGMSPQIADILKKEEQKFSLPPDQLYHDLGIGIAEYFLQAERSPGHFMDCHDLRKDIWGGYLGIGEHNEFRNLINARCNGEAMSAYLRIYTLLGEKNGRKYLDVVRRVVAFYAEHQLQDGSYGRWWDCQGTCVNAIGTNGAHILSLMVNYSRIVSDATITESIRKAYAYYADLIRKGEFYADTLDADSCDKEAGLALMDAMLDCYELPDFHTEDCLDLIKTCADFLITWIFQDNIVFPEGSMLGKRNFHTRGLSAVSIAHHHLDFYGPQIAWSLLRLSRYTQDHIYAKQAGTIIEASSQLISRPGDTLGRSSAYYGWVPEQINQTQWDYFGSPSAFFGNFGIDIAWVHVLMLDCINRITVNFPDMF